MVIIRSIAMEELIATVLDSLNEQQRQAVTAGFNPVLVIAGAGSGKTRVLVHRIAFLLATSSCHAQNILALTFTNKAAWEIRHRVHALLHVQTQGLWVGTFHGIAHLILRIHHAQANLPQNFQILDSDDQLRVIKKIIVNTGIGDKLNPHVVQDFINDCKEKFLRAKDIELDTEEIYAKKMQLIYAHYENYCQQASVLDFAELLLRCYELLARNKDLLLKYQQKFKHILVDEFQDVNSSQYAWLKLLTGENNLLFVVGDDDQAIYGWRGAKVEYILRFSERHPHTQIIKLEQNYRSTATILTAANNLIANNRQRLTAINKKLYTNNLAGDPIYLYTAYSEIDEAEFVATKLQQWKGILKENAILYRTAAQSRVFEEIFLDKGIPYRIYGGLRFYERAEIKNILAYLRLIANRNEDGAFERIINTPRRGIGNKTTEQIRELARAKGISLWDACMVLASNKKVLAEFINLINLLATKIAGLELHEQVKYVLYNSKLHGFYSQNEDDRRKLENLAELINAAKQFANRNDGSKNLLTEFLAHASLESGESQAADYQDYVVLMTLHSAKGLEFTQVFLCGLEEGLFPHERALRENQLEEERRLCYVGITRAKQCLYLCHSETRVIYGRRDINIMSRFIREIPIELIQEVRLRSVNQANCRVSGHNFQVGNRVEHPEFGLGRVLATEGENTFARILVEFDQNGQKWLLLAFSPVKRIL
jgi:DNA helicase II / ATP-dependent DNA helicase PcrA